ncbi:MAG: hypothetical protein WCO06_04450 [Candidatus Roizmanbacteria bacterium]
MSVERESDLTFQDPVNNFVSSNILFPDLPPDPVGLFNHKRWLHKEMNGAANAIDMGWWLVCNQFEGVCDRNNACLWISFIVNQVGYLVGDLSDDVAHHENEPLQKTLRMLESFMKDARAQVNNVACPLSQQATYILTEATLVINEFESVGLTEGAKNDVTPVEEPLVVGCTLDDGQCRKRAKGKKLTSEGKIPDEVCIGLECLNNLQIQRVDNIPSLREMYVEEPVNAGCGRAKDITFTFDAIVKKYMQSKSLAEAQK